MAFIITVTFKVGTVRFMIKMQHSKNMVLQKVVLSPYSAMKGKEALCYPWIENLHLTHYVHRMLCFNQWTSPDRVQQQ